VNGGVRILLARRASGCDHAAVFEPDALRVEGAWPWQRRVAYRRVHGLERAGAWLWVGAGLVPAVLGGCDVPAAQLDLVAAELRARVAALPDGARRRARIDARRAARVRPPWLTLALGAAFAGALAAGGTGAREAATPLLFVLALGALVESWLGPRAALAGGAAALLAAGLAVPSAAAAGPAAFAARVLPAGWIGLAVFARLACERRLSVRARGALDLALPLALAFAAHAAASRASPLALGLAALAGCAAAPLVLRERSP
jgi:hypothetical protein